MTYRATFFIATTNEEGLRKFVSEQFGRTYPVALSPVEKGGYFKSGGYLLELLINKVDDIIKIESEEFGNLGGFCGSAASYLLIGAVKESEFGRNATSVRNYLNIDAFAPHEICRMSGVDILKISKILPSFYNLHPVLNPIWKSLYDAYGMTPRILIDEHRGAEYKVVIDWSYMWRYWTVFSYDNEMISNKLKKLREVMIKQSSYRESVANSAVSEMRERIADEFKLRKKIDNIICFALAGSVLRGDAIERADIDILFIFDDHFFPSDSIQELKLKLIVFKKILEVSEQHDVHLSLHTVPLGVFFTTVMEGLDPHMLNIFVHSKPLAGKKLYSNLKHEVHTWKSYKKLSEKINAELNGAIDFSRFQYQLLNICEDPAKNAKIRAETIGGLKKKVRIIEKLLAKAKKNK